MKALVINETRLHYGFVIDVERNRDGSYYDTVAGLVYEARELQFQWQENPVDWSSFRREAAKDILCALVSVPNKWEEVTYESFAYGAVRQADELIKQLRDGQVHQATEE